MLVGEIGITTGQFYYGLRWWEIKAIIRGYNRRHRDQWSATRWQTYNLMCAFASSKSLHEAGIHSPTDLIKFPWEKEPAPPLTEQEYDELQDLMAAENARLASERQSSE